MKKVIISSFILVALLACNKNLSRVEHSPNIAILPYPKSIKTSDKGLLLTQTSKIAATEEALQPLVQLFQQELESLTDVSLLTAQTNQAAINFVLDTTLATDTYHLDIDEKVIAKGSSYTALAMAKNTLLQLVETKEKGLLFPILSLQDSPDAAYRGLMIDLARKWHSMQTIKQVIDMAAFYKINYLHLHFTDHQSYTLPSKHFPKLATTDRHYSFTELQEMESYSQTRGVTIIPEIDVPGHAYPFVNKYPEVFALQDTTTNPWIINMGRESVYEALDVLIGEVLTIFRATPYFHIGGDEANFEKVMEDPAVKAYIKMHQLENDVHELYRHFLVRMNDTVKKHGKQMCVWEGFGPTGTIPIPKDILVFEFETNRYLPNELVADGYTVVNTSWKPLYVVNQKKWSPKTIYDWNIWRWENWWDKAPSFDPIQLKNSPLIVGAEMCAWEQPDSVEIPSIRKRLPVMVERIWNQTEKKPYEEFATILEKTDKRLSKLINDNRQDKLLDGYEFSAELLKQPEDKYEKIAPYAAIKKDIDYAAAGNPRQTLDIFMPKNKGKELLPAIVYIHGGAWLGGQKTNGINRLIPYLKNEKYIGISINYRLSGEAIWPAQIHDCKAAIRYIKANAEKYGIDKNKIGVWGTSAGGHLVGMLALTADNPALEGTIGNYLDESSSVTCAINGYGPSEFLSMDDKPGKFAHLSPDSAESKLVGEDIRKNKAKAINASPTTWAHNKAAPMLLYQGLEDKVVIPEQSALLFDKLQKVKANDIYYIKIAGGKHGVMNETLGERMNDFFDRYLYEQEIGIDTSTIQHLK